jgi:hypothetical protein
VRRLAGLPLSAAVPAAQLRPAVRSAFTVACLPRATALVVLPVWPAAPEAAVALVAHALSCLEQAARLEPAVHSLLRPALVARPAATLARLPSSAGPETGPPTEPAGPRVSWAALERELEPAVPWLSLVVLLEPERLAQAVPSRLPVVLVLSQPLALAVL